MARFCTLFSGSSGNCTYIGGASGGILVDAGRNMKQILLALEEIDVDISSIHALLITHEHSDHVSAVKVLAGRKGIPVYATEGTLRAMEQGGYLSEKCICQALPREAIEIAGMEISTFPTSHDCEESCGYLIRTADGRKIAVCTDLGYVSREVRRALTGCDLVMLESNHDVRMLESGAYPYYLKRRILGECGHLSNALCACELPGLIESGTTRLVLSHLSRENNYPELARQTAVAELEEAGMREGADYELHIAPRLAPGNRIIF